MKTFPAVSAAIKNYKFTENAFLPKIVTIPLSCENDTECKCIVKPGDRVNEGDVIGIPLSGAQRASKIHASIPGIVLEISPCVNYNGKVQQAVKIKLDGKFQFLGKKIEPRDYKNLSADDICNIFFESGVVNTFNVSRQEGLGEQLKNYLERNNPNDKNNAKNSTETLPLVVRLFDEDNMRLSDALVTKFYSEKITVASEILASVMGTKNVLFVRNQNERRLEKKAVQAQKGVVQSDELKAGKEDEKKSKNSADETKSSNSEKSENTDGNSLNFVNLYVNVKKYPSGTPREIIAGFNKSLKKLCNFSVTKDCIFVDASTLVDVYDTVVLGMPVLGKNVHFSGDCLYSSCVLNVRSGTTLRDIVFQLGGFEKKPALIIINGLVCGSEVFSLDVPVTRSVKSVTFISGVAFTDSHIYSCIRCGQCRKICPVNIQPDVLCRELASSACADKEVYMQAVDLCTDCGLCNSVCPSRIPLCQTINILKEKNKEDKK